MRLILVALTLSFLTSHAQTTSVPTNVRAANLTQQIKGGMNTDDLFFGIPLPPGKVVGDTYLTTRWRTGSILLYSNDAELTGYPLRYDIKSNEVEINTTTGIKVINGIKIRKFTLRDSLGKIPREFVNGKTLKNKDQQAYTGFFEVLTTGKMTLLKKTTLIVKRANYNVQLNVGSRDDEILKEDEFYALVDDGADPLPSSRKKFFTIFGDRSKEVMDYAKKNSLGISKENDLSRIFDFYNQL